MSRAAIESYYTKVQIENLIKSWGMDSSMPKKGHGKQLIVWANGSDVEFKAASIEWSERKSDHGERLYLLRIGTVDQIMFLEQDACTAHEMTM